MPQNEDKLDQELLAAHARGDKQDLIRLFAQDADMKEEMQDIDAACFYLTHTYIFALDIGADGAQKIHARLKARGREE